MLKKEYTEQELLTALAQGDRHATQYIYSQHYPIIYKWIMSNTGTEEEAADIFQEAIIILFRKSQEETFRLSSKISTYLFAISKHLWYKKLKSNSQTSALPDEDRMSEDDEGLSHQLAYSEDITAHEEKENQFALLEKSMQSLGEPCSSLLKAFYQEGKNMQEIATQFGYTNAENAKNQKYKCLTRLKKIFNNEL